MKKLMALCLSLLMALSMCSFTVMAAGEATFADIADGQPQNFVVNNLVLGNHTITSSNTDVISTSGVVTRPLAADATVELTIDGGAAFNVIVKAQNINVLDSYDFSTASTHAGGAFDAYPKWSRSATAETTAIKDGKFYLDMILKDTAGGRPSVTYTMPTISEDGIVGIEFDVSDIVAASGAIPSGGSYYNSTQIRTGGYLYNAAGTKIGSLNVGGNFAAISNANGFGGGFLPSASSTRKNHVSIKYNPLTGEVWGNDVLSTKSLFDWKTGSLSGSDDLRVAKAVITTLYIQSGSDTNEVKFNIDNFVVYQEADTSDAILSATDAEKVEFFKGLVENTNIPDRIVGAQALDLDAEYEDYDLSEYGVSITWASDNTMYIANDGTVNAAAALGKETAVNMTATIVAGDEEDTVVFPITITDGKTSVLQTLDFSDLNDGYDTFTHDTTQPWVQQMKAHYDTITGSGLTSRFVFHADVKYTPGDVEGSRGGLTLLTFGNQTGIILSLDYNNSKIGLTTTTASVKGDASGLQVVENSTVFFDMPASVVSKGEGEWVHVMLDHNAYSQTYYAYVDGEPINDVPLYIGKSQLDVNGGGTVRGFRLETFYSGTVCIDNVSLSKFIDAEAAAVEVNAALNAALVDYASEAVHPVLINQTLPAKTIGPSWIGNAVYNRDLESGKIKPTNVSTYKYVEDGPAITWEVDGQSRNYVAVDYPKEVQLKVTATKGNVTESKTVTRKVAPADIRELAISGDTINGAWLKGATGKKLIVATYLEGKLVNASIPDLATAYNAQTGILSLSMATPAASEGAYDEVKLFLVSAENGITPLAFAK